MGFERPVVLYDASVLYPFHLRNLLVQLAVERVVTARWTDAIHEEWIGALARDGRVARDRLVRTRELMKAVLPEADVRGYEHCIAGLELPDPDDRHVVAAAIEARAPVIVTRNLRDFPPASLEPHGIRAEDPDGFLTRLHAAAPELIAAVAEALRRNLRLTVPSAGTYLDTLRHQGLSALVARLGRPATDPA
jgi:hypothetical protein